MLSKLSHGRRGWAPPLTKLDLVLLTEETAQRRSKYRASKYRGLYIKPVRTEAAKEKQGSLLSDFYWIIQHMAEQTKKILCDRIDTHKQKQKNGIVAPVYDAEANVARDISSSFGCSGLLVIWKLVLLALSFGSEVQVRHHSEMFLQLKMLTFSFGKDLYPILLGVRRSIQTEPKLHCSLQKTFNLRC